VVDEVHRFRLRPDVSEETFLAQDARVQTDFYYQQPGIVRRLTAKGADGEWLSVVYWRTQSDVVRPDDEFLALVTDVSSSTYTTLD
jgi:hypothetical protein